MKKVFLLLIFLLFLVSTCTKNPSGPTAPEISSVYMPFENKVFVIDSSQDKVVDSMRFNFYIHNLNLSPNKRILYIQKSYPDTTIFVEVDVKTKEITYSGSNSSLYLTPDGKYLVSPFRGLRIFSAETHDLVYENVNECATRPAFDSRLPLLFIALKDERILVFDYAHLRTVRFLSALTDKNFRWINDLLFSEVDNRLYFTAFVSLDEFYLGTISIEMDKIMTLENLGPWWHIGFLFKSVTTNKIYVLATCICAVIPELIPFNLFSFSQRNQKVTAQLELFNAQYGPFGLQILDDGKRAYVSNRFSSWVGIVDLIENKFVGYISN